MSPDPTDTAAAMDLCFRLMRADTEAEVVGALSDAGYWDDPAAWRLFSDNENAFAVIGNQQAEQLRHGGGALAEPEPAGTDQLG